MSAIGPERHVFAVGVVGGPTVVIDYGRTRFVTDPTFDEPRDYGVMAKLDPPSVPVAALGDVDAVLLSHDDHYDNLDVSGREWATTSVPLVVTGPGAATRLGGRAIGLSTWQRTELTRGDGTGAVTVTAVPAVHGPLDGTRDGSGHVNAEVTGFVLRADGLPTVYISGDNASLAPVAQIARRFEDVDVAVLFAGASRLPTKNQGRPLTLTGPRAADVAAALGAPRVVIAHIAGWSIYSESLADVRTAFDEAGIADRLVAADAGTWSLLDDS
ncbi:MBL fold metallo-hydrolase [Mycolicibacterium sp. S2-37]|uniref:MBL fold metallo-hydrolase n=1 Tax=Mycolicibacterium sp. S2-37 TaxID=2810297 RepID=UPI001A941BE4|nr:MBL fold metallo-hydrolase [Mycolicibacterium sp. S2-37]MBO0681368.1 MBL fold metallo-hydrolase [Mycolicibacterium sp. S2-37]